MTTKDGFLFQKDKYLWNEKCQNRSYSQYSNLNLNRTPSLIPVQFCNKITKDKTWNGKKKHCCSLTRNQQHFELKDSAISNNYEKKKKLQTWNKNLLTIKKKSEKEKDQKNWKKDATLISTTTNVSTPKAYEYLFESDEEEIGSIKKHGNEKPIFTDIFSTFIIQNSFEFPRQQNDKISEPEMSQFKASQTLLNPNDIIYPDESSIPSYSIDQSLLDAFIPPGWTPVASDEEDEDQKINETASNKENVNQSTSKSAEIETANCNEDKSLEIFKDSSNRDLEVDQSLTPEAKANSPIFTSLNTETPAEQRNSIFKSQSSRLALLLPRFRQSTTSAPSSQTASIVLLPSVVKKTNPKSQQHETFGTSQQSYELTSTKTKRLYATNKHILSLLPSDVEKAKKAIPQCQQHPQQPHERLSATRKTKGSDGKVLHPSLPLEAKADSAIPTSTNAKAEKRNNIFRSQPFRLAIIFPRLFQLITSAPSSQTTNQHSSAQLSSDVSKIIPQPPNEKIPLTTGKVLDQSFNAAKLPEIDSSLFKKFLWIYPDNTAKKQNRQNSGKKRAHSLTPQRQQNDFIDNRNDESLVASRVPPKRVPPNSPPSENVLDE